jgi:hypothetical protein
MKIMFSVENMILAGLRIRPQYRYSYAESYRYPVSVLDLCVREKFITLRYFFPLFHWKIEFALRAGIKRVRMDPDSQNSESRFLLQGCHKVSSAEPIHSHITLRLLLRI